MMRLLKHKGSSVFVATFVVVLLSGVALAQVSMMSSSNDPVEIPAASMVDEGSADIVVDEAPLAEPKDETPAEEPKDETPAEEPKDETPAEEPKDEAPAEEPKDETPAEEPKDEAPAEEPKDDHVALTIASPVNGSHVEKKVIRFKGTTDPDAVVTMSRYEADQDAQGNWSIFLTLRDGENTFTFRAVDAAGNVAEKSVTVHYDAPVEEPKDHAFTAHQKWEASDDTPPRNLYWGTATPEAKIWIASAYGSAQVRANGDGVWEAKVIFEGAPESETFKVVVESSDGGRAVFSMKVFYPKHEEKHEFTANQKYGSCGEPIPYDVFWGTATPGAKIWIESAFGGGVTQAGDLGHWELKVKFPEAPIGETFKVYVESSDGGAATFTFVATGGEHGV
jgi:hypothetical protein